MPAPRTTIRMVLTAAALTFTTALVGCSNEEPADPVLTTQQEAEDFEATTSDSAVEVTETITEKAEDTPAAAPKNDRTNATGGTVCGEVSSSFTGQTFTVVALTDGIDCDEAMEVFSDYMSDSPSGEPPQGSGAFWNAPNGWLCGANNYLFPGDEDYKLNKYPSCGPADSQEAVVAVDPERVKEIG